MGKAYVACKMSVASFTDAWIETGGRQIFCLRHSVASFTDAWIETANVHRRKGMIDVASFTDAWIETPGGIAKKLLRQSHLLQMRGLKHDDEPA